MRSVAKAVFLLLAVSLSLFTPVVLGSPGYRYLGIHWNTAPGGTVAYEINQNGCPDIPGDSEFNAVQQAFQTWEDDPSSCIDFSYVGTTSRMPTLATTGDYHQHDNHNVLGWANMGNNGYNALTAIYPASDSVTILEEDTYFNTYYRWSTSGAQDALDVQNVATHEAGHFLQLDEVYLPMDNAQTMYPLIPNGETTKRTLEWGDCAGVRYVYANTISVDEHLSNTVKDGDLALGLIDSDPRVDMVVAWVDGAGASDVIRYRIGFNINPNGQCAVWSSTYNMDNTGVGEFTAGSGVALTNLDANPRPELVFLWVDDPYFDNTIYYKIGWNIGSDGVPTSWSAKKTAFSDSVGWYTSGASVQFKNLDANPLPEIIVSWVDDADQENTIYWRVGWNVGSSGDPSSWGTKHAKPGWVGWYTGGVGIVFAEIGGSASATDMLVFWVDQASGGDRGYCQIGWDMRADGTPSFWSDRRSMPIDWSSIGGSTEGCGLGTGQIGLTDRPDFVFIWFDYIHGYAHYRVQYDTQFNFGPYRASKPSGPLWGFVGEDYYYNTSSTDPESDPIQYTFDWGDSSSTTTAYAASGQNATASHVWLTAGYYTVRVIARDSVGAYSEWGAGEWWSESITMHILSGTCPYVYTWNGREYVVDNNLLPKSELGSGTDVEDYYELKQGLIQISQTKSLSLYSMQIHEDKGDHDYLDQFRLVAIDHSSKTKIALSPTGEILTFRDPRPPLSCFDPNGTNRLNEIRLMDGDVANESTFFDGQTGDCLILNFGEVSAQNAKLVMRSDRKCEEVPYCCIEVQTLNDSIWRTIATIAPRENWAVDAVNLSPYIVTGQNLTIRLFWTLPHRLDFVGLDTSQPDSYESHLATLVSAVHSTQGNALSVLLQNDQVYSELVSGQRIQLLFVLPRTRCEKRTFILYSEGHYVHIN